KSGKLPVRSCRARKRSRIAACPFVSEYKLHMAPDYAVNGRKNKDGLGHLKNSTAEMTIPDYQTLMLPVLRLSATAEQRVGTLADPIADTFGLSQSDRETMLPSGRQRLLYNRIHWAKLFLSRAGLLTSPGRGRFIATQKGR